MITENSKQWIWLFIAISMSIICAGNRIDHRRNLLAVMDEKSLEIDRADFKVGTGEILVRDSILYNSKSKGQQQQQQQQSPRMAKRMFPMMRETITNFMQKIKDGATKIKDMIMPKKKDKKKPKLIYTAPPPGIKLPMKMETIAEMPKPMHTPVFMEQELQSFPAGSFKPSYELSDKDREKMHLNPYNDGKFEAALLELEKKEELKFEATMHTFAHNRNKISNDELINSQVRDVAKKKPTTKKPEPVSELHTSVYGNDNVKPVKEEVDDIAEHDHKIRHEEYKLESTVERPSTTGGGRKKNKHHRDTKIDEGIIGYGKLNSATTERANYPDSFFDHRQVNAMQLVSSGSSNEEHVQFLPTVATESIGRPTRKPSSERFITNHDSSRRPYADSSGEGGQNTMNSQQSERSRQRGRGGVKFGRS